jgi:hypothetical protein
MSEEFAEEAAKAGLRARRNALASGHPVVFVDERGRYIEELPDGTRYSIRLKAGLPRESHLLVLGELSAPVE